MITLAIESTCDETAAAVVKKNGDGAQVVTNVVASSQEMHDKYGGIVPEVAAREQVKSIIPVLLESLPLKEKIDSIAVSFGPGLMGSLLVGVETARVLSWAWKKPLYKVNHLAAHLLANWIGNEVPPLPSVGLVVSGGHTDFVLLKSLSDWEWIGGTRDDAVGEAFDKVARLLGLPYPGGPELDKVAGQLEDKEWEKFRLEFLLPRPLLGDPSLDMSFSGIKAAAARMIEGKELTRETIAAIARSFSESVCDVLAKKTELAMRKYQPKSVIVAGGVAANKRLREKMKLLVEDNNIKFFVPELKYCGDNAAMVGAAAVLRPDLAEMGLKPVPSLGVI